MLVDLSTDYLGLKLRNPLVAGASPITGNPISVLQLEAAGVAAIVLPSLFEEQITQEDQMIGLRSTTDNATRSSRDGQTTHCVDMTNYNLGPENCLRFVETTKKDLTIPVVASMNCSTLSSWIRFARLIESAGADALELNVYIVPNDARITTREIEDKYAEIVSEVTSTIDIPVAVKLVPFFSSLPYLVNRLVDAGAKGVTLFNRFIEPTLDIEKFEVVPRLELSRAFEQRLPLRWIGVLRDQVGASLAASTGFHDATDVLKAVAVGADVVQMASVIICSGPNHIAETLTELTEWLDRRGFQSIEQLRGVMSQQRCPDPSVFDRPYYMNSIAEFSKLRCRESPAP